MINDGHYHRRGMNPSHLTPHSCCKPKPNFPNLVVTEEASFRLASQATSNPILSQDKHSSSPCCRRASMTGSSLQEKTFLHSSSSPSLASSPTHPYKTFQKALCVPANWKRVVHENKVAYISPSQCQLGSIAEVVAYLQTEGTCKCGLECPLVVTRVFNFDPQAEVSPLAAPSSPCCCLLHKLSSKSAATGLPKKENLLTYKRKRLTKGGKTRSPFDGVLVSQLLAQRDRLGMKRKEAPLPPAAAPPPQESPFMDNGGETKYFHLLEDPTKPFPILSHPIIQNVNIITGNTSYNCPPAATANPAAAIFATTTHIGSMEPAEPSSNKPPFLAAAPATSTCSSTRSPHLFHSETPPKPLSFEAMQFTSVSPFQTYSSSPNMTFAPSFPPGVTTVNPASPSPKILQAYETPCSTYQRVESSQFVVHQQPAGCISQSPTLYPCHQPVTTDKPPEGGRTNVLTMLPSGELVLPDDLLLSGEMLLDRIGSSGSKDEEHLLKMFQERKFSDGKTLAAANPAISSVKFSNTSVPSYFSVAPTQVFSHCSSFTTDSSKKVQCQYVNGPAGLISLDGKPAVTSVTTSLAQVIPAVGLAAPSIQPMVQVINTIPINAMQNTLLISAQGQPSAPGPAEGAANVINILPATQTYVSAAAEDAAQRRRARPRKINQTVASMLQQVQPAATTGLVVQQAQQIIHPMLQTVVLPSFTEASAPRPTLFPQLVVQPLGTTIFQVPGTLVAEGPPQDSPLVALQPSAFSNGSLVPNPFMAAAANSIPIIKTEIISNPALYGSHQPARPHANPYATTTGVMYSMGQDGTFAWPPPKMEAAPAYGQLCKDNEGRSVGVQSVEQSEDFYSGHKAMTTTGSLVVSSSQPSPPEAEYVWPPDPGNLSAAVRAVIQSEKIYKDNPYYMEKYPTATSSSSLDKPSPEEAYGLCNSTTAPCEKGWQAKCDTTTGSLDPASGGLRTTDGRRKRHRWDDDSLNQELQEVRS